MRWLSEDDREIFRGTPAEMAAELDRTQKACERYQTEVARLRKELHRCKRAGTPYADERDVMNAMTLELEELRAIVSRLPTTADGVPVIPGEEYYSISPTPPFSVRREVCRIGDRRFGPIDPALWYSTREAAEKAREE